jgi:protease II
MKGKAWHNAGKGRNRLNASRDLNRCAQFLRQEQGSESIALRAFSAGVFTAATAMQDPAADGLYSSALFAAGFLNPYHEIYESPPTDLSKFEEAEWGPKGKCRIF